MLCCHQRFNCRKCLKIKAIVTDYSFQDTLSAINFKPLVATKHIYKLFLNNNIKKINYLKIPEL